MKIGMINYRGAPLPIVNERKIIQFMVSIKTAPYIYASDDVRYCELFNESDFTH